MSNYNIKKLIKNNDEKISDKDLVKILNVTSKIINKKMKIAEHKYGIKFKLEPLSIDNGFGLSRNINISTVAKINGPIKGEIPINTTVNFDPFPPVQTISAMNIGVPLTPFGGPIINYPTIALNQFGNRNSIEYKNQQALKYLEILKKVTSNLEALNSNSINKKDIDKTYFNFVDLDENNDDDELYNLTLEGIDRYLSDN